MRPPAPGGYAYQWWILPGTDGVFEASGIFGQTIYINPARHVVIVELSAWPQPDPAPRWEEIDTVMEAIAAQISFPAQSRQHAAAR